MPCILPYKAKNVNSMFQPWGPTCAKLFGLLVRELWISLNVFFMSCTEKPKKHEKILCAALHCEFYIWYKDNVILQWNVVEIFGTDFFDDHSTGSED